MPKFTLSIEGESPISGDINLETTSQYYKVLHDIELGELRHCAADSCPEVFNLGSPLDNNSSYKFPLNQSWQIFSFGIFVKVGYNKKLNELTNDEYWYMANRWSAVYLSWIAFCNGMGSDKNHNYIMGTHPDRELMAYDKIRVCGGATITGKEEINSAGQPVLRVDTFNGLYGPPSVESINPFTDRRIFFADIVHPDGHLTRFTQLNGYGSPTPILCKDVPVPIIADEPVYYPMWKLKKLPLGSPVPFYLL